MKKILTISAIIVTVLTVILNASPRTYRVNCGTNAVYVRPRENPIITGTWATGTVYISGQVVNGTNGFPYMCVNPGTSSTNGIIHGEGVLWDGTNSTGCSWIPVLSDATRRNFVIFNPATALLYVDWGCMATTNSLILQQYGIASPDTTEAVSVKGAASTSTVLIKEW